MVVKVTPLRCWLNANNLTLKGFARELNVSRGRVQFWVRGQTMPQGEALDNVMTRTGLTVRQLLPDPRLQEQRREWLQKRLERAKRALRRVKKAQQAPRAKKATPVRRGR